MKDARERLYYPVVVLLDAEDGLKAPLFALSTLLAQTLKADFGDTTLVLHLVDPLRGAREDDRTDERGVDHVWVEAPATIDRAVEAARVALKARGLRYAFIFLDLSRHTSALGKALAAALPEADIGELAGRLVHLCRSRINPARLPQWSILRTDLLAPRSSLRKKDDGIGRSTSITARLLATEQKRLAGVDLEEQGDPYPRVPVDPEFCRVRLDLDSIAKQRDPDIGVLSASERAALSRWARAISYRRVGLALGGSGAWGYAHVALMQALEAEGVPIDIIGGTSSGSLMGAYYAVLGSEGLELAIMRGPQFQRMVLLAMISSAALERRVDIDLGRIRLDDLELIFLPVATNLTSASPEIISRATVGFGVRASGTAPGFFAATIAKDSLYVDGAITDNVPVNLVERMGAALTVGVNALPPPRGVRIRMPKTPIEAFLEEFSPIGRVIDFVASFSLMVHDVGDFEATDSRILFDPPAEHFTLFKTFEFDQAKDILAHVRREKAFHETVEKTVDVWRRLSSPRSTPR